MRMHKHKYTHKMAAQTDIRKCQYIVSLSVSYSESICNKESIKVRSNWYVNYGLQSNQFVGRKKKKKTMEV